MLMWHRVSSTVVAITLPNHNHRSQSHQDRHRADKSSAYWVTCLFVLYSIICNHRSKPCTNSMLALSGYLPYTFLPTEAASLGGNSCQTGNYRQGQIPDHAVQRVRFLLNHSRTHKNPRQRFLLLQIGRRKLTVGHFSFAKIGTPSMEIHFILLGTTFLFFWFLIFTTLQVYPT